MMLRRDFKSHVALAKDIPPGCFRLMINRL